MAKSILPFTWKNGFREPGEGTPWATEARKTGEKESHYVTPPSAESLTSTIHNSFGLNVLRTWPTIYNGTSSPQGLPEWWNPAGEVDVLICGGSWIENAGIGLV
jgi:phenol 2-monooxygenase